MRIVGFYKIDFPLALIAFEGAFSFAGVANMVEGFKVDQTVTAISRRKALWVSFGFMLINT